jgi:hypothetical protein
MLGIDENPALTFSVTKGVPTGTMHQVVPQRIERCDAGGTLESEGSYDLIMGDATCSMLFVATLSYSNCMFDDKNGMNGTLETNGVVSFACNTADLANVLTPATAYYQIWAKSEGLMAIVEGEPQGPLTYMYFQGKLFDGANTVNIVDAVFGGEVIQQSPSGGYSTGTGALENPCSQAKSRVCEVGDTGDKHCQEEVFGSTSAQCQGISYQKGLCVPYTNAVDTCEAAPFECCTDTVLALPEGGDLPLACMDGFIQPKHCSGDFDCRHGATCNNTYFICECVHRTTLVETSCNDKIDNDLDGDKDCFDADCCYDTACPHSEGDTAWQELCAGQVPRCGDGICTPDERAAGIKFFQLAELVYCAKDCCPASKTFADCSAEEKQFNLCGVCHTVIDPNDGLCSYFEYSARATDVFASVEHFDCCNRNGICEAYLGENMMNCGDPSCNGAAGCSNFDCGCNFDGICQFERMESRNNCPDCINAPSNCGTGDHVCNHPPDFADGRRKPIENRCNCPFDCGYPVPEKIIYTLLETQIYGLDPEYVKKICSNGLDDDCDGLIDCQEPDCHTDPDAENPDMPPTLKLVNGQWVWLNACVDGLDNDCDGFVDCSDPGCQGYVDGENDPVSCHDGINNDCDEYIDCDDPGCKNIQFENASVNEWNYESCADGIDNDCDGQIDCAEHYYDGDRIVWECVRPSYYPESFFTLYPEDFFRGVDKCTDRYDNDCNGQIDCDDPSCQVVYDMGGQLVCEGKPFEDAVFCRDGQDNDEDGYEDCEDINCKYVPCAHDCSYICEDESAAPYFCTPEDESNPENDQCNPNNLCSNGRDDDNDTLIDCLDPDCKDVDICMENGNGGANCNDGKDNDLDGFVDCPEDPDCTNELICTCPNNKCDGVETDSNCPEDCSCNTADFICNKECEDGSECGVDQVCDDGKPCFTETVISCSDCHCGNGIWDANWDGTRWVHREKISCGDGEPTCPNEEPCCEACPEESLCGNGTCDRNTCIYDKDNNCININEDASTCPEECHCGNGICEDGKEGRADHHENDLDNPNYCLDDCHCGNGICEYGVQSSYSGNYITEFIGDCGEQEDCVCVDNGTCDMSEHPALGCADYCGCNWDGDCDLDERPGVCSDCSCIDNGICDSSERPGVCSDCSCIDNGICDSSERPGICDDCLASCAQLGEDCNNDCCEQYICVSGKCCVDIGGECSDPGDCCSGLICSGISCDMPPPPP